MASRFLGLKQAALWTTLWLCSWLRLSSSLVFYSRLSDKGAFSRKTTILSLSSSSEYPKNLTDAISARPRRRKNKKAKSLQDDDVEHHTSSHTSYARKQGLVRSGGTGATVDRIAFRNAGTATDSASAEIATITEEEPMNRIKKAVSDTVSSAKRWFVQIPGNETDSLIDTTSATDLPSKSLPDPRIKVEAFFQANSDKVLDITASSKHELKIKQLAAVLGVPQRSSRIMIKKIPTLQNLRMETTVAARCIEHTLLLGVRPARFAAIVKRCPSILTYRTSTLAQKLVDLQKLLSCEVDPTTGESLVVSESTLAVAKRVPDLLGYDIQGKLMRRSRELRRLFFGEADADSVMALELFRRVVRRCPEIFLYSVDSIASKLELLTSRFPLANLNSDGSGLSLHPGVQLVLKEPRLLLYSDSLFIKASIWRDRVDDAMAFDVVVANYPTLLMYSFGSAARLEYFAYLNKGTRPDPTQARKLIMLPKKSIDAWGDVSGTRPLALQAIKRKRGRPPLRTSPDVHIADALSYREWLTTRIYQPDERLTVFQQQELHLTKHFGATMKAQDMERQYGMILKEDYKGMRIK